MKKNIHPESKITEVTCSTCNTNHELLTTNFNVVVDVCSGCHAFYTGDKTKAKSKGRVERFNKRVSASIKK
ncbi:MAG: 50S ribosomal protein L31 [Metamycoplasmataceae bacterium]